MGFRPPLDLDDFIEAYEPWLHGRSKTGIDYGSFGSTRESTIVLSHTREPLLVGAGPESCSTCTDLVVHPEIIWDVNGYYKLLNIDDYRCSKKDIRVAFTKFADQSGDWNSIYIINAYKQLIDEEIRREYDAMPLGSRYMNDPFIQQEIKQKAQAKANERQQSGEEVSTEEVLNEMGFEVEDSEEPEETEQVIETPVEEESIPDFVDWGYSYFLWNSISMDEEPLFEWQTMICRQLQEQKVKVHFGVGWRGDLEDQKWSIQKVDDTWVIFLSENVSIKGMSGKVAAAEAAGQLLQMMQTN